MAEKKEDKPNSRTMLMLIRIEGTHIEEQWTVGGWVG